MSRMSPSGLSNHLQKALATALLLLAGVPIASAKGADSLDWQPPPAADPIDWSVFPNLSNPDEIESLLTREAYERYLQSG